MMLMDVEPKIKSEDSETAEINELAQQIKASNDKLRSGSVPMRSTAVATQMNQVEIAEKDTSSLLIHFGWETIPNRPAFPFVRRGSQCFVANQICRKLIFCDVNKKFSLYTTDCLPVDIKNMTKCEADVFNEINIIHCDKSLVGDHYFQEGEAMTDLQDVKESFRFFEAFENAMLSMKFENDLFGFLKIAQENEVPFAWSGCKKLVPLFYFEGQSEYLDSRSIDLTDKWKLGYLKLCCLVQNIRKDLYNASLLKVVDFEDVKELFPENTSFELCWPEECNQELLAPEVRLLALYGTRGSPVLTAGVSPVSHFQQVPESYVASEKNAAPPEVPARHSSLYGELLASEVEPAAFHGMQERSIPTAGMSPVSHSQQVPDCYVSSQKNVAPPGIPAQYSSVHLQTQTPNTYAAPTWYPCSTVNQSKGKLGNEKLATGSRTKVNLTCRKRRSEDNLTSVTGNAKRRNRKDNKQNSSASAVGNNRDGLLGTPASLTSNIVPASSQNIVITPVSPCVSRTRTTNVPCRSPQTASSPELRLHSPLMSEAATSRQITNDSFHTSYTPISVRPETSPIWTAQQINYRNKKRAVTQFLPTATPSPQANTRIPQNYQKTSSTQRPPPVAPVAPSQTIGGVSECSTSMLSTNSTSHPSITNSQVCSAIPDELFSVLNPSLIAKMPQSYSSSTLTQAYSRNRNTYPQAKTHEVPWTSPNNFSSVMCHQSPTAACQRSMSDNRVISQISENSSHSTESQLISRVPSTRPRVTNYGTSTGLLQNFSSVAYNGSKTSRTTVDEMTLRKKVDEFIIKNINFINATETENSIKDLVWSFMLEQQMTSVKQQRELGPLIKSEMQYIFKLMKQNSSMIVNNTHPQKAPIFGAESYERSLRTLQSFNVTNVTNVIQMTNNQQMGNKYV